MINDIPKITDRQKEALNFYARSHYLIINNLMCKKFDDLIHKYLSIVNTDDKAMIKEALEQGKAKRFDTNEEWGEKIFNAYVKRTSDTLSHPEIEKHLAIAAQDILEINQAMSPLENDLVVFRKVHLKDHFSSCGVGEKKEIPCFCSTSITPDEYKTDADVVLYKIQLPKGTPVIRIDLLDEARANEYFGNSPQFEKEVLLPPMCFQIMGNSPKEKDNIKGYIDLKALYPLDVPQILHDVLNCLNKDKKISVKVPEGKMLSPLGFKQKYAISGRS